MRFARFHHRKSLDDKLLGGVPKMAADDPFDEFGFPESPGTATIVRPKAERERTERRVPRYNVILWNSDDHTFEYVERMLRELFGHTKEECHKLAETVDAEGRAVVLTTTKEHAELKRDQILAYGKDENMANCKGSLHATIEEA
jgi:ATP-dependent Clp protease adaptor protein ClpS